VAPATPDLEYDPDEAHRTKHQWDRDEAAIVVENHERVGKCPAGLKKDEAQRLLETGLRWWGRNAGKARPERVYNVREGVPYRAHIMGRSYHGFPEKPSEIPPDVRQELRRRAANEDQVEAFDGWMKLYERL
jgi:hypothetical protein